MAAALLAAVPLAFVVGLRVKHRRFLIERARRYALEHRFDAYRLADTRTDLDQVGPISGEHTTIGDDLDPEPWVNRPASDLRLG